jgi:ADP-heptose:LPS heptosyltransferase
MRRLVIRPGAIGDFIVSLPAIEALRTAEFEVWTPARTVPLVKFANWVRSIQSTGLDLLGVMDPPPSLMADLSRFDSIISWYGANRPEFRDAVAGLPFEFLRALPAADCAQHATDFYLDQVRPFAANADGPAPVPRIPCDTAKGDYAVIHPFSGSPRKNWPLDRFRALASRLPMPVRWCSGEDDPPLPEAVRIPDLGELACFLAGAVLYIGNDSGITHLAAAVGTPTLAIFGPTDPQVWAPRGDHVRVVRAKMEGKG